MKQQRLQKILELLGADKLRTETQESIKNNLTALINKTCDHNVTMNELLTHLGANILNEGIQTDLKEKINTICTYMLHLEKFQKENWKWNTLSENIEPTTTPVSKDQYIWESGLVANEKIKFFDSQGVPVKTLTEKINKDQYRWPQDVEAGHLSHVPSRVDEASGAGASSMFSGGWNRPANIIYIDNLNKKILFSPNPNFTIGATFDENMSKAAGDLGYSIAPVNTRQHGWRDQIKLSSNGRN